MNDIKSFIRELFHETFREELSDEEYNTIVEKVHKVK
jgi:hypothetical protein